MAVVEVEKVEAPEEQNDSSDGLARMYQDLQPYALKLKSSATVLLLVSIFFCGSLEGLFGIMAAMSVLCCAAPGSLGTAYAARCTKILAIVCAVIALSQLVALTAVSIMMPTMPHHIAEACDELNAHAVEDKTPMLDAVPAQDGAVGSPALVPESSYGEQQPVHTSQVLVTVIAAASRRLQQVAPETVKEIRCERAQAFVANVAPFLLLGAMIVETLMFMSALSTIKAATNLLKAARRYGANAI